MKCAKDYSDGEELLKLSKTSLNLLESAVPTADLAEELDSFSDFLRSSEETGSLSTA